MGSEVIAERLAHVLAWSDPFKAELIAKAIESDRSYHRRARLVRKTNMSSARKIGRHTPYEWRCVLRFYGSICLRCGYHDVEKEHIVPVSQGGSDSAMNLQPLCISCNSSKGAWAEDFRWDNGEWMRVVLWETDGSLENGWH